MVLDFNLLRTAGVTIHVHNEKKTTLIFCTGTDAEGLDLLASETRCPSKLVSLSLMRYGNVVIY